MRMRIRDSVIEIDLEQLRASGELDLDVSENGKRSKLGSNLAPQT